MTTRRQVLQGLPAIWIAPSAPVNAAPKQPSIDDMVADLTAKLTEMHGGEWKSTIDSQSQFVMLCRR